MFCKVGLTFVWTEKCEPNFQLMKEELTVSTRVLSELGEPDKVYHDAFHRGRGCVLRQHCKSVQIAELATEREERLDSLGNDTSP
jgi:hypothetical protein